MNEINVFLQCMLATIIGSPKNYYEYTISEVYFYSYLNFLAIMNMKLSSHDFLFHGKQELAKFP